MKKVLFWITYLPIGMLYLFFVVLPYEFFDRTYEIAETTLEKYENWVFKD